LRVHGAGRHRDRQAGGEPGISGDVAALLADLVDATADHLSDQGRIQASSVENRREYIAEQFVGAVLG
jgi:hypothetical protein